MGRYAAKKFFTIILWGTFFFNTFLVFENVYAQPASQGSGSADISISVSTPLPQLSIVSPAAGQLNVYWNWDNIAADYYPPPTTEVRVEISSDLLNYSNVQVYPFPPGPGATSSSFFVSYAGLPAGTYTAQVTVVDGTNSEFVVGPVTVLSTSSGGGAPGFGGNPGSGGGGGGGTTLTDFQLKGLSYPSPNSLVVYSRDGVFQSSITPNNSGAFQYNGTMNSGGIFTFSFSAQDPIGVLSAPVSFDFDIIEGQLNVIDAINMPPTIVTSQSVISVGEALQVSGYAYTNAEVTVSLNGLSSAAYLTSANASGAWTVSIDTSGYGAGTYDVLAFAVNQQGTIVSPDSSTVVIELLSPAGAAPVCGNNVIEAPEECDDGNRFPGDGCNFFCQLEFGATGSTCGNAILEGTEQCDDGNISSGDGCSATCVTEALALCGNGIQNPGEGCDDGNIASGDGCSSLCQLETLPDTSVDQPIQAVINTDQITLTYQVLQQPNGPISLVRLYYSLDGATPIPFPQSFNAGVMSLSGLADGVYEVYSIATDQQGFIEATPLTADATFTIDAQVDFTVKAWPEKRLPPADNWGHSGNLSVYESGTLNELFNWDTNINNSGIWRQDATAMQPGIYKVVYKGISHLSRRLQGVNFNPINNVLVDFTLAGTQYLLAGDVHQTKDDYVNGLDISATVIELYRSNLDADLNADGLVNALDLSVLLVNLYKSGEGA